MKLDKNELNGYWFEANAETFDALVEAGYYDNASKLSKYNYVVQGGSFYEVITIKNFKQAYYHNGEFFTRNENGEIRGLWITNVPLEEQAYIDACEIVGTQADFAKDFLGKGNSWLNDYGATKGAWFYSWNNQKGHQITWQDFIRIFGEEKHKERWMEKEKPEGKKYETLAYTADAISYGEGYAHYEPELTYGEHKGVEKVPFAELDINKKAKENIEYLYNGGECVCGKYDQLTVFVGKNGNIYQTEDDGKTVKGFTGLICKLKKKPTNPYVKLKAEYAEAKAKEHETGVYVKVFFLKWTHEDVEIWRECQALEWDMNVEYQLRYYTIDWNKVLETSYRDGEFVECEFWDEVAEDAEKYELRGIGYEGRFIDFNYAPWDNCRLPKGTPPKDEWLVENEEHNKA